MTNVILASGRGVPSTKNRIVIRCRVAGPNEVSIHEEGGTAERRNWGFLGEITNVDMMTSATSRKPAECSRESLPLAGLVEHQTPGRPKARPKKKDPTHHYPFIFFFFFDWQPGAQGRESLFFRRGAPG